MECNEKGIITMTNIITILRCTYTYVVNGLSCVNAMSWCSVLYNVRYQDCSYEYTLYSTEVSPTVCHGLVAVLPSWLLDVNVA